MKKVISYISILLIIGSHFFCIGSFDQASSAVLGTFIGVILLWIAVDIGWPSLLCIFSLGLISDIGMDQAFKTSFGNTTFSFLLFTFVCTYAIAQTSLVKKIALLFVTSRFARRGPWHMSLLLFLAILTVGLVISPTVLFFLFLPIVEEIFSILNLAKGTSFASMLMIGLVICCNLSAGMTPIAHIFPVLAIGVYENFTGNLISYGEYMKFGIPIGLVLFVLLMVIFRFVMRPEFQDFRALSAEDFKSELQVSLSRQEKMTIIVFSGVVLLWILPSLVENIFPEFSALVNSWGTAFPPLLGVILMTTIKSKNKPLINLNEAITKGVSWPSLIMGSATLALGSAITAENINLLPDLMKMAEPVLDSLKYPIIILLLIILATIGSNITSHMVTAQVVTSFALPIALGSNGNINAAAITIVIGMLSSLGSAAPPAMPFVAIAGTSGWTTTEELFKYGTIYAIGVALVLYIVGYPLATHIV